MIPRGHNLGNWRRWIMWLALSLCWLEWEEKQGLLISVIAEPSVGVGLQVHSYAVMDNYTVWETAIEKQSHDSGLPLYHEAT